MTQLAKPPSFEFSTEALEGLHGGPFLRGLGLFAGPLGFELGPTHLDVSGTLHVVGKLLHDRLRALDVSRSDLELAGRGLMLDGGGLVLVRVEHPAEEVDPAADKACATVDTQDRIPAVEDQRKKHLNLAKNI